MQKTFGERIIYNYNTGNFETLRDGLIDQKQFISSQRTIFIPPGSPDPNTCTSIHVYVKVMARFCSNFTLNICYTSIDSYGGC